MKHLHQLLALCVLASLAALPARAADVGSVPAPAQVYQVGQELHFQVLNGYNGEVHRSFTRRVVAIEKDGSVNFEDFEGGKRVKHVTLGRDWTLTFRSHPYPTFEPFLIDFSALIAGKKEWREKDVEYPRQSGLPGGKIVQELSSTLVGEKSIKVPAGTFPAFVIRAEGVYKNYHPNGNLEGQGQVTKVVAFDPKQGPIRMEYNTTTWAGKPYTKYIVELVPADQAVGATK